MASQKVYRSHKDRIIGGVCGGLGEYFDVDATLLRLGWVAVTIFSGIIPGVLVYIVALFLIPKEPIQEPTQKRGLEKTVIEVKGHADDSVQ